MRRRVAIAAAPTALAALLAGCGPGTTHPPIAGASASHGKRLIEFYGCGSCHAIGGIATANGTVGPSLVTMPERQTIAGKLPNTAENLERWIRHPQQIVPGTIMPDLGVTEGQARDIVEYLERGQ
jgi:cytochrome c1